MGDLRMPEKQNAAGSDDLDRIVEALENWRVCTEFSYELVVPGGNKLGAHSDFVCSAVRRVEHGKVAAGRAQNHPNARQFINRLSDLLFVVIHNVEGKVTYTRE